MVGRLFVIVLVARTGDVVKCAYLKLGIQFSSETTAWLSASVKVQIFKFTRNGYQLIIRPTLGNIYFLS